MLLALQTIGSLRISPLILVRALHTRSARARIVRPLISRMDDIRITTYNVLSSRLAPPDHFPSSKPEHLNSEYRFKLLTKKLSEEIESNAVICLQEVSMEWAGRLHTFFAQNNYRFVTALYGRYFNGYMGVATAWPDEKFELLSTNIKKVGETVRFAYPPRPTAFQQAWEYSMDFVPPIIQRLLTSVGLNPKRQPDEFDEAFRRQNEVILAHLRIRGNPNNGFWIGNYHMPCMFQRPSVMMIHVALVAQYLQQLAGSNPHILVGTQL